MPFAAVQTSNQVVSTTTAATITINSSGLNNLVVVHVKLGTAGAETLDTVTDNMGNTYVISPLLNTGNFIVYQAHGVQVIGGASNINLTFSTPGSSKRCGADEYSGGAITNATVLDARTTGTNTSTTLSVSTLTPVAAGELIVATMALNVGQLFTAGSNYILYNGSDAATLRSQYRLSGGASETAPATIDTSQLWGEIATAFFAATTGGFSFGGPGSPHDSLLMVGCGG